MIFDGKQILSTFILFFIFSIMAMAQSESLNVPKEWQTWAEQTDYRQTPRYAETIAYSKRLAAASPLIRYAAFGKSGEGRDLPLLIASTNNALTPEAARKAGKAIVFIQACIHAGESDGKDAGLALLRDVAITKTRFDLLKNTVILFVPIYNTDGHERFSPHNRINQNGPEEMGFRANATNLNLNRDYMKADAPETRAWLRLWNQWKPDLFIDCHVTNGADYRYNLTYEFAHHQEVAASIRDWSKQIIDGKVVPAVEREGNLLSHYLQLRDNRDLSKGTETFIATPRFATGYTPLRNRPGILIETHMLKPYRPRVRGTYDFLWKTLEAINEEPQKLFQAIKQADEEFVAQGKTYVAARQFPLRLEITDKSTPFLFKGIAFRVEQSDISGAQRLVYEEGKPLDATIPHFDDARIAASAPPPLAYVVPAQWTEIIERLELHGLKLQKLAKPLTIEVESYRLTEPRWSPVSFENRVTLNNFKSAAVRETRTFPENSVIVSLDQPDAAVAIHLLEPNSQDSFLFWGFFNSIFEQKEYAEAYKLEKLAREMLAKDENLRREFEEKLKTDEKFAANPRARLTFFFDRSPYFDRQIGVYPIGRITTKPDAKQVGKQFGENN